MPPTPHGADGPRWRRPEVILLLMAASIHFSFASWNALLNNFVIERAAFGGAEIGLLQSIREIPGFLAFGVVFALLVIREQRLALISIALMGIGTALTGFFPTALQLYATTLLMSLGFHYYETIQTSLTLQWFGPKRSPPMMGRLIAAASTAALAAYAMIYLTRTLLGFDYRWVYAAAGGVTLLTGAAAGLLFPSFQGETRQHNRLILRRRYWLYYALTFLSGARRQIFVVFAGFLMVQRFGYSVEAITALFLVNCLFNMAFAARIGRLIGRWGERRALTLEYIGLIGVFLAYSVVDDARVAAGLYLIDHAFFAMAIAIRTYFQKIADPADIASTAGVGFSINHIAAVVIPVCFGLLWNVAPHAVFLAGAGMAAASLVLARRVPPDPAPGREVVGFHADRGVDVKGASQAG